MSLRLAVTGNIASGKTRVAEMFRTRGCALIDADKIAHGLYDTNPGLVARIAGRFGSDVVRVDGTLDRKRLGSIVFADPEALTDLGGIVHPELLVALRARIEATAREFGKVVVDAALIFEWGIERDFDAVILVVAPEDLRLDRAMARDGLGRGEAEARIRSQVAVAEKIPKADYVIENAGTIAELEAKVGEVWEELGLRT